MVEYIEREAFLSALDRVINYFVEKEGADPAKDISIRHIQVVRDFAKEFSAADVVEVVRCRDCKHYHGHEIGWCDEHSHFIGSQGEACHPWESNDWKMFEPDDFCSCGERREADVP